MRAMSAAAILAAALLVNGASAKPETGLSPAEAAALFAEAQPHIEAVMGYRSDPLPRFRMANQRDFDTWRRAEVEAEIGWQFPDIAKAAGTARAAADREVRQGYLSASVTAASGGREIILLWSNAPKIALWNPALAGVNTKAFAQLAIVHEAVSMALESRYNVTDRQRACGDPDSFFATLSLVKGRAQWVTREVAKRLGTVTAFPLLAEVWLHIPDRLSDPALRAVTQEFYRRRYWMLTSGLAFQDALVKAGITDEAALFNRNL